MLRAGTDASLAVQPRMRGTADAVLAGRNAVAGSVIVVNADDLYPASAFAALARHLRAGPAHEHAMIGFRLDRTLVGRGSESRALLEVDNGLLVGVREGRVEKNDGLHFVAGTASQPVEGDELISMNIWAFRPSVFDAAAAAMQASTDGEVYLPDVVAHMIASGEIVRVIPSDERCIGMTYRDDVAAVRSLL